MTTQTNKKFREYVSLLERALVQVSFEKAGGALRLMKCTLHPSRLPETDEPIARQEPSEKVTVWDVDANDWRSFRLDRLHSFLILESLT